MPTQEKVLQNKNSSTPSFCSFDPTIIPFHDHVLDALDSYDYDKGMLEIFLSGSVGSAKSILIAHVVVRHCLDYKNARVCVGRRTLPDLKSTIFQMIIEHLEENFIEGKDYHYRETTAYIKFKNGSEIVGKSWADKRYKKFRSLALSAAAFEEITENNEKDKQAYEEIKMRVGRLSHIPQKFIISASNPDGPQHWAYDYFIKNQSDARRVFYSRTEQNPFLPASYIDQLKRDMDPKTARRMLYGEWVDVRSECIYYAYDSDRNFIKKPHEWDYKYPVHLCWDFNIGQGKPLSGCLFQYINDIFHVGAEFIIEGARTLDSCDELWERGLLKPEVLYIIHGDATGGHKDTRNLHSDWDLIKKFFSNMGLKFKFEVPRANPPIRTRHNTVNAYCKNEAGQVRLFVYQGCETVDQGLRLTELKDGSQFIENDEKAYQHVTTSLGYGLISAKASLTKKPVESQRR